MNLQEKIQTDMTAAMRASSAERLGVLRLIKTSFKNEQIKLGHELSEDEALKVVSREAKQRRDSIAAYDAAGRADLSGIEAAELKIIEEYLPKQLGEAEIKAIIDEVVSETGASSKAQMGQVMGLVMKRSAGAADGGLVAKLVNERLS